MEWEILQEEVFNYDKKYGWERDKASHVVLHLSEELGEISRLMLRYGGYKKEEFKSEELGQELTDLLYLALKLANKFNLNLDKEWKIMWKRYQGKVNRR